MTYQRFKRPGGKDRRDERDGRRVAPRKDQGRSPILDEFYFNSVDEVFRRWPDEMWASKGRPRLWVKMYEKGGATVWRDVAYGRIKLQTPHGVSQGEDTASVNGTAVVWRRGTLEIYIKRAVEAQEMSESNKPCGVPQEDACFESQQLGLPE